MKSRWIVWWLSLLLTVSATSPCFAQSKATNDEMTLDQIRARAADAQAKNSRLIVTLKNGSSVSGTISNVSQIGFVVNQWSDWSGKGARVPVEYAGIASVKGRNPVVKLLKNIGQYSLLTAAATVMMPLYMIAALLGCAPSC